MKNNQFDIYANLIDSSLEIQARADEQVLISLSVRNMEDANIVSSKGGSSVNIRNDKFMIVAFKHEDSVVVQFINKTPSHEGYHIQFEGNITPTGNNMFLLAGESNSYILAERCTCVVDENNLRLYPTGTHTVLTFYIPDDATMAMSAFSSSVQASTSDVFTVPAGARLPEFSIGIFDDSSRNTPRPMRLGVPVISTVPVYRAGLSAAEMQVLEIGKGTDKRAMYFKIISDVVIPDDVEPVLNIYLPEGLDTIGLPKPVEMVRQVSADASRSVFYSSYIFHTEDTLDFVDGFAYLSVYMPMEIETDLPLALATTPDGAEIVNSYSDNPELG